MELGFAQATFEKSTGVNTGRDMSLDVKKVTAVILCRRMEEMIEADIVERRGGCKTRDMTAQGRVHAIGLNNHRHGVPTDERTDSLFENGISRALLLDRFGDRIDIRRRRPVRQVGALSARSSHKPTDQVVRSLNALTLEY